MATSEKRTLSITAKLVDEFTRPLGPMATKVRAFANVSIGLFGKLAGTVFSLRGAVAGLVAAFAGVGTLNAIKGFGDQADALQKLADATGDSIENISELQAAFAMGGVEDFTGALNALVSSQRKALDGNQKLTEGFASLGVSVEDLQSLGPAQLFERMALGLEGYNTAQEKAAALGRVLPKPLLALLPVLGQGLREFQDAILEVRDSGATVTGAQAAIGDRLGDSLDKIKLAIGDVGRALLVEFGPPAIALFERLAKGISQNKGVLVDLAKLFAETLVKGVGLAVDAIIGLVATIESIKGVRLIDVSAEEARIAEIQRLMDALPRDRVNPNFRDMQNPEFLRLSEELNNLSAIISDGLAGRMRKARDQFVREFRASVAAMTPKTPDETAAALGVPNEADWQAYARNMQATMDRTVFRPPAPQARQQGRAPSGIGSEIAGMVTAARAAAREFDRLATGWDRFVGGFRSGMNRAIKAWTDLAAAGRDAGGQLVDSVFGRLEDAFANIVTGATNAKEAFKEMGRAILADIARIVARLAAVQVANLILGQERGGVVGMELGGVIPMATGGVNRNGGVARRPTILFGEGRNAEAFVPLPDNRSIPVTFVGGSAGGGQSFHFTVHAMDSRDVRRMLVEHSHDIRTIWAAEANSRHGLRQVVQRVAS